MGYSYGFHLAIVKPPKSVSLDAVTFVEGDQEGDFPIETYAKKVVEFCSNYHTGQNYDQQGFYFPDFGTTEYGGSKSYGCGDQNNGLEKTMATIGKKFPEAIFAIHYYYRDMSQFAVFTFQGDKILDETHVDFENFKIGSYTVRLQVDFMQVAINGNMSMFFNKDYGYDFDFAYERIYECAGIFIPEKTTRANVF